LTTGCRLNYLQSLSMGDASLLTSPHSCSRAWLCLPSDGFALQAEPQQTPQKASNLLGAGKRHTQADRFSGPCKKLVLESSEVGEPSSAAATAPRVELPDEAFHQWTEPASAMLDSSHARSQSNEPGADECRSRLQQLGDKVSAESSPPYPAAPARPQRPAVRSSSTAVRLDLQRPGVRKSLHARHRMLLHEETMAQYAR